MTDISAPDYQRDPDLEPLELSKEEQNVIIARMKKLAKDPSYEYANALELVHQSYTKQDWERQQVIGDIVRPSPPDRRAWKQYEQMIALAVKLLSKYRGVNGLWRSERYDTIPTNQRASMGSMAAARIKTESIGRYIRNPLITEGIRSCVTIGEMVDRLESFIKEYAPGFTLSASPDRITVYNDLGIIIDTVAVTDIV